MPIPVSISPQSAAACPVAVVGEGSVAVGLNYRPGAVRIHIFGGSDALALLRLQVGPFNETVCAGGSADQLAYALVCRLRSLGHQAFVVFERQPHRAAVDLHWPTQAT